MGERLVQSQLLETSFFLGSDANKLGTCQCTFDRFARNLCKFLSESCIGVGISAARYVSSADTDRFLCPHELKIWRQNSLVADVFLTRTFSLARITTLQLPSPCGRVGNIVVVVDVDVVVLDVVLVAAFRGLAGDLDALRAFIWVFEG